MDRVGSSDLPKLRASELPLTTGSLDLPRLLASERKQFGEVPMMDRFGSSDLPRLRHLNYQTIVTKTFCTLQTPFPL